MPPPLPPPCRAAISSPGDNVEPPRCSSAACSYGFVYELLVSEGFGFLPPFLLRERSTPNRSPNIPPLMLPPPKAAASLSFIAVLAAFCAIAICSCGDIPDGAAPPPCANAICCCGVKVGASCVTLPCIAAICSCGDNVGAVTALWASAIDG